MVKRTGYTSVKNTEQDIANLGFDRELNVPVSLPIGYDGQGLQRSIAQNMAIIVVDEGETQYLAMAAPGTNPTTPKWQARKIDKTTGLIITWADGDSEFDNKADDLLNLNYI
jgi:hypothetical protein